MLSNEFHPAPKPKHKRNKMKRVDRNNFSYEQREEIRKHYKHTCQECGRYGRQVHHIKPKGSSNGRAVFTNALVLCHNCHEFMHSSAGVDVLQKWQKWAEKKYGIHYFRDKQDLKERYNVQQRQEENKEIERWMKFNAKAL